MDEFMFWLLAPLQGIDGLTLLIFIVLFGTLMWAGKGESPRRDSKRRNQAHRIR